MPKLYIFALILFVLGMLIGVLAMWWFDSQIFKEMRRIISDQDKRIEMLSEDLERCIDDLRSRDFDVMGIDEEGDC